jgi:large subunit ribosomal protein L11
MAKAAAKGVKGVKEVLVKIKLQASGGQATPAPPIGPALGQHGVNIGQFVSQFNERTKELNGTTVPVVITVYTDKSFTFEVKSPPAAVLLKMAANIAKGSGVPNKEKVGKVTAEQVRNIAQQKMKDLNAYNLEQAEKIIRGTARSMGVEIEG